MKLLLSACALALMSPLAGATEIVIGDTHLSIPAPAGFAPVTRDMKPYAEFAQRFVPETNEQFALFLSPADAAEAAKGGMPVPERKFYVQTAKALIQPFVGAADFAKLKDAIKTQNADYMKKVEAQMPGMMKKLSQGISDDYQVDVNLLVTQMLPFPPHYESERALGYSMLVKYSSNDANGKVVPFEGIATATFVYVRGKVLFLYANAEKDGLKWSRTESRKWAEMVIAANPSEGEVAVRETTQRASGFDWSEVGQKALIGAVVGGIIGLLSLLFKKKKG